MQLAFFVRLSRLLPVVAFAGLMVGCGDGSTATPVTKEQVNTAKQNVRESRKEAKEAREHPVGNGGGAQKRDR
jgi:hypothetical protein